MTFKFKIVLFMWQFGLIDTFSAVFFLYNLSAQYSAVVIAALVEGNATQLPRIIFEPIIGLGVAYRFVKATQPTAEQRARVATLAALSDFIVTTKSGKVRTVSNLTSNIISRSKWVDFYENIGL